MNLVDRAIKTVKDTENERLKIRKSLFIRLLNNAFNLGLLDIELDNKECFVYDGVKFNITHPVALRVLSVNGKAIPSGFDGIVKNYIDLGNLIIKMGLDVPKISKCRWDEAWVGICNIESDQEFCHKHRGIKCGCGAQATHNCPNAGSLVCGRPLCDRCICNT